MTAGGARERVTPDGRYFVVRGRLWRRSNPALPPEQRATLVRELMNARRAVKTALRSNSAAELALARRAVDAAKVALGERGPVWWDDGTPDLNRHKVKGSPYDEWYRGEPADRQRLRTADGTCPKTSVKP